MAKDEEEVLVPIEDGQGPAGETVETEPPAGAQAQGGDERLAQDDDDDGEQGGQVDAATEAIRARRREERRAKKIREHQARERTQKELNLLRARNETLEREHSQRLAQLEQRSYHTESSTLENQLGQIEQQMRVADDVIAQAVTKNDGASMIEAQRIRDDLVAKKQQLTWQKGQLEQASRQAQERPAPQAQPQAPRVAPEVTAHANAWRSANPWYTGDKKDPLNAATIAIDDSLIDEGYDPSNEDYWSELTKRVSDFHKGARAGNGNGHARPNYAALPANGQSNGGPRMANGARERQLKPGEVYVSPDRKQAMIDAGVWDDPKLRTKFLKSYKQYDEEAAARPQ